MSDNLFVKTIDCKTSDVYYVNVISEEVKTMTANEAQAERNALDDLITCQLAELTPEERKRILDILTGMTLSKKAHEASSKDD